MVLQDLDFIFDSLDVECRGYLEWIELKEFDECLFYKSLDIEQIEASIKTVSSLSIMYSMQCINVSFK